MLDNWLPLTYALNAVNRSMGRDDLYPFTLAPPVIEKLRFVHERVYKGRLPRSAQSASTRFSPSRVDFPAAVPAGDHLRSGVRYRGRWVTIVPDRFELALPVGPERLGLRASAETLRAGAARSETALIRGVRAGSDADLEVLFRRHWPRAYRTALLIVHDHGAAEDIAQEGFLAALRHLDRFDVRRRFGPGCAGSWPTARSTGRGCAAPGARPRRPSSPSRRPAMGRASRSRGPPEPDELDELLAALAHLHSPTTAPWWSCATSATFRPARSRRRSGSARNRQLAAEARP